MIEVSHLTKRYGRHCAVDDISFTVQDGGIYGLLGPNGAGKSTTMNVITGYLSPTSGTVRIDGHDIVEEPQEAKACIGYLPEQPPLYTDMTVAEYLQFVAELKGVKRKSEREAEIERAMGRTGLEDVMDRLIRNLSKGYRQRVGIAATLLGNPKVIILDEPTVGLDPAQMIEIRSLIHDLGETHTVILSSHILSEVQAVCDRVLIIAHGKLIAQGTPEELAGKLAAHGVISATAVGSRDAVVAAARTDRAESDRREGRRGELYRFQRERDRSARCAVQGNGGGRMPGDQPVKLHHKPGRCVPATDRGLPGGSRTGFCTGEKSRAVCRCGKQHLPCRTGTAGAGYCRGNAGQ